VGELADPCHVEIGEIGPVPGLTAAEFAEKVDGGGVHMRLQQRQNDQHEEDEEVVERKNAQRSAGVKVFEIVRAMFAVEQDPCDEEAGKHEKKIHAPPA